MAPHVIKLFAADPPVRADLNRGHRGIHVVLAVREVVLLQAACCSTPPAVCDICWTQQSEEKGVKKGTAANCIAHCIYL